MTRLSKADLKRLGIEVDVKPNKYHAEKTTIDGITFDSQKEAERYGELKLLMRIGEVTKLELQPEFELQPGFRDNNGKWVAPIKYRADFRITYLDGRVVVEDVKGHRTATYLMKAKMLKNRYPEVDFREV